MRARILRLLVSKPQSKEGPSCLMLCILGTAVMLRGMFVLGWKASRSGRAVFAIPVFVAGC